MGEEQGFTKLAVRWRDHNDNERQYEQYHTREATHNDQRDDFS